MSIQTDCPFCRGTGYVEGIDPANPEKLSVRPCPNGCEDGSPADDGDAAYDQWHDEHDEDRQ